MKTTFLLPAALALGFALLPQVAVADVMTSYNTNAAGGNGFYNGTGNSDGSFTTTTATYTAGTISLSLRGAHRFNGPITPTGDNDYACSGAGQSYQCNFEWSVATTGFDIDDFTYNLVVTDLTSGQSAQFDPSGLDDSYWDGGKTSSYSGSATGFENSEYLGFSFLGLGWNSNDQVVVTLSALPVDTSVGADPSVTVGFNNSPSQVPEPTSVVLMFTVAGLCWNGLKRRREA